MTSSVTMNERHKTDGVHYSMNTVLTAIMAGPCLAIHVQCQCPKICTGLKQNDKQRQEFNIFRRTRISIGCLLKSPRPSVHQNFNEIWHCLTAWTSFEPFTFHLHITVLTITLREQLHATVRVFKAAMRRRRSCYALKPDRKLRNKN
jgi:hypothetical protein